MGQPQVSVVIPVWNGERYLKQAIESILAQDFPHFELIIVDDGSTDNSARIAASFAHDCRVSILKQENAGVVAARNSGLRVAQAEFVAFLDADDIAKPNRLTKQFAYLQKNPNVAALGSHITYFNESKGEFYTQIFPVGPSHLAHALKDGNPLAQPAVMMRKSMALAAGGYREAFRFGAEDYDLWLRLSERHPLDNLPEVLTLYRIHTDSLTHQLRHEQALAGLAAACAHRRRVAGLADPIDELLEPLTPAILPQLNLSEEEEAAFLPSLIGLISKRGSSPDAYTALANRAWALRRHMRRGRLVRHCLAPVFVSLRKAGRTREAFVWLTRSFVTDPLSTCWMLMR